MSQTSWELWQCLDWRKQSLVWGSPSTPVPLLPINCSLCRGKTASSPRVCDTLTGTGCYVPHTSWRIGNRFPLVAFHPSCLVFQNYPAPVTIPLLPAAVALSWSRFALHAWRGILCKAAEVVLLLCGTENPLRGEHSSSLTLETPPFWLSGQTLESSWCPQKVTQRRRQRHVPCMRIWPPPGQVSAP